MCRYHQCLIKLHDHDTPTTEHMYPGMVAVEEHWEENTMDVPTPFKNFALREHRTRWDLSRYLLSFTLCVVA